MPRLHLIAAMSLNHVIGRNDRLPWDLPDDLANFHRVTAGKAFIMGRKSYESEHALLSEHRNIILTRRPDYEVGENCGIAASLEEALALLAGEADIFVLGGGGVYAEAIGRADFLHLTVINAFLDGDTFFPGLNWAEWKLLESVRHEPDERHAYAFAINRYGRRENSLEIK